MADATVALPTRFNLSSTHWFVAQVVGPDKEPIHGAVTFDFSRLAFIDGAALTAFHNTLKWLASRGVRLSFSNFRAAQFYRDSIRYLDDCGFFRQYLGESLRPFAAPRGTTLPAQPIRHANSFGWIQGTAGPWIANHLNLAEDNIYEIRACVKEIFNNIMDHSTEDTGFVHLQLYPNLNQLCMTIADFGIGIPAAIGRKFETGNDADSIELATREGVTTKEDGRAAGAGLNYLLSYVAIANAGRATIYSGYGGLFCAPGATAPRKTPFVGTGYFPGTLLDISFRTDRIAAMANNAGDLEW